MGFRQLWHNLRKRNTQKFEHKKMHKVGCEYKRKPERSVEEVFLNMCLMNPYSTNSYSTLGFWAFLRAAGWWEGRIYGTEVQ